MPKILIETELKQNNENTSHKIKIMGILNNNEIIYHDQDILVTLTKSDNKIEMERVHLDYEIYLVFIKNELTKGYYYLTSNDCYLDIDILTNSLYISDDEIIIEYKLTFFDNTTQDYTFNLNYTS